VDDKSILTKENSKKTPKAKNQLLAEWEILEDGCFASTTNERGDEGVTEFVPKPNGTAIGSYTTTSK
jgi:hypothetical protein